MARSRARYQVPSGTVMTPVLFVERSFWSHSGPMKRTSVDGLLWL